MGCSKIFIFLSIWLCATIHVQAARPSTISGAPFNKVMASHDQSSADDLTSSRSTKKIALEETRPRLWWQISQKLLARQMGSKPPNCEDKCNFCHPCEAVEVPISNREVQKVKEMEAENSQQQKPSSELAAPDDTNYMPESWRCACGNNYFNP
ncbi:hypothetical protein R1sor_009428 [Riccia sorocarpa]|uniref:Epidermal patterning factor-like protein n=1 Tax=Riccia sorocarpa TaxID=122646 RepID=A0ABD3HYL6_9MARC